MMRKPKTPVSEIVPDVILGILAVAGLVISGWSLATLLHGTAGAPWWVACFGVAVFDLVAMASAVLVYARRGDPWSALGARLTMTAALASSAVINGAHGAALGGWPTAAVLAAAPLSFEIVFELRHRTLTALVWILFRKDAWARLSQDARGRLAASVSPAQGDETVTHTVEQVREPEPARPLMLSQPAHEPEPVSHSVSPDVRQLITRLTAGEALSAQRAAELLGVSRATGGRRLTEARAALSKVNGS